MPISGMRKADDDNDDHSQSIQYVVWPQYHNDKCQNVFADRCFIYYTKIKVLQKFKTRKPFSTFLENINRSISNIILI